MNVYQPRHTINSYLTSYSDAHSPIPQENNIFVLKVAGIVVAPLFCLALILCIPSVQASLAPHMGTMHGSSSAETALSLDQQKMIQIEMQHRDTQQEARDTHDNLVADFRTQYRKQSELYSGRLERARDQQKQAHQRALYSIIDARIIWQQKRNAQSEKWLTYNQQCTPIIEQDLNRNYLNMPINELLGGTDCLT